MIEGYVIIQPKVTSKGIYKSHWCKQIFCFYLNPYFSAKLKRERRLASLCSAPMPHQKIKKFGGQFWISFHKVGLVCYPN
jgi:hypothetical protein